MSIGGYRLSSRLRQSSYSPPRPFDMHFTKHSSIHTFFWLLWHLWAYGTTWKECRSSMLCLLHWSSGVSMYAFQVLDAITEPC